MLSTARTADREDLEPAHAAEVLQPVPLRLDALPEQGPVLLPGSLEVMIRPVTRAELKQWHVRCDEVVARSSCGTVREDAGSQVRRGAGFAAYRPDEPVSGSPAVLVRWAGGQLAQKTGTGEVLLDVRGAQRVLYLPGHAAGHERDVLLRAAACTVGVPVRLLGAQVRRPRTGTEPKVSPSAAVLGVPA